MNKIKIILITIFFQILHLSQIAQSTLQKNNWYIGSKISLPQYNNIITYIDHMIICNNIYDSINNSHVGFGSLIGYQNNQNFSFELSYNWLGKITYANEKIDSTFKIQSVDIILKLHHPVIANTINAYAKLGGAIWHANIKNTYFNNDNIHCSYINDTSLSPLICIGIEYEITKKWKTQIEYQRVNKIGDINTIGAQSNNIAFNFNIIYHFI